MKTSQSVLRRICSFTIGVVFFLSGIFKLIDPVGAGLVMESYLNFFHMPWLVFAARPAATLLALLEALTGAALIVHVYRRVAAAVVCAMTVFFTIITAILAIFNPVFDCGCFGEVLHLSHLQTLLKNIVLLIMCGIAFIPFKNFGRHGKARYASFWNVAVSIALLCAYSYLFIPPVDLTEFNASTMLAAAIDEGNEPRKEFVSTFIYEKNGQRGRFTLDKLPDSTWTYIDTEVIEKMNGMGEYEYPELPVRDADGNYRDTLAAYGEVVVISSFRPDKLDYARTADLMREASEAGFNVLFLSTLTRGDIEKMASEKMAAGLSGADLTILLDNAYSSDYRKLISLNRSNGGATYFNGGNLIRKWSARRLPERKALDKLYHQDSTEVMIKSDSRGRIYFEAYLLYAFVVMLFV